MPTLDVLAIKELALDLIQGNTDVDAPFDDAEILRHINEAYRDVWEVAGGAMKRVAGPSLWDPNPATGSDGVFLSTQTDVGEVRELFYSISSSSMGDAVAGDTTLDPVDFSTVVWHRRHQALFGSYAQPKVYSVTREFSTEPASVNKVRLDVWPGVVGANFPTHYVPQFTPLDYATVTVPAVNDLESSDIGHLAAIRMAPLAGRAELVPDIASKISQRTQEGLARKASAAIDAKATE